MRKSFFVILSALLAISGLFAAIFVLPSVFTKKEALKSGSSRPTSVTVHGGGVPVELIVDTSPFEGGLEVIERIEEVEEVVSEPVPYFPPPSINLTGGTLGRQAVPGTDDFGDISQLYFSDAAHALYVAMVEKSGYRSIWRLDQTGLFQRVFADDDKPGEIRIMGDGNGVIYVMLNAPDRVYRTDDFFKLWYLVMKDKGIFWNLASDKKGNVYGALHSYNEPILYRSTDNGFAWEPWIDFRKIFPQDAVTYAKDDDRNKLRHLHDVIYDENTGSLIVGTGDVARYTVQSDDNGASWKKVWGEGFTAHTAVTGTSLYLLCPDKLRGPGIALYSAAKKTLKETFSPGDNGYAGYCYSVINVDGIYYASLHTETNEVETVVPKSGIVVSPDAEHWYTFVEWAPLTNHARTDIWLAAAPGLVYASINARLYAFSPVTNDWFLDKTPLK